MSETTGFVCPECFHIFSDPEALVSHYDTIHKTYFLQGVGAVIGGVFQSLFGMSEDMTTIHSLRQSPGVTVMLSDEFKKHRKLFLEERATKDMSFSARLDKIIKGEIKPADLNKQTLATTTTTTTTSKNEQCGQCKGIFSLLKLRIKYHCRFCGIVLCFTCLSEITAEMAVRVSQPPKLGTISTVNQDKISKISDSSLKLCLKCYEHAIQIDAYIRAKQNLQKSRKNAIVSAYNEIKHIMKQIETNLEVFTELASIIFEQRQYQQYEHAVQIRAEIVNFFGIIDTISLGLVDKFKTTSNEEFASTTTAVTLASSRAIASSLRQYVAIFVEQRLFPLRRLPTIEEVKQARLEAKSKQTQNVDRKSLTPTPPLSTSNSTTIVAKASTPPSQRKATMTQPIRGVDDDTVNTPSAPVSAPASAPASAPVKSKPRMPAFLTKSFRTMMQGIPTISVDENNFAAVIKQEKRRLQIAIQNNVKFSPIIIQTPSQQQQQQQQSQKFSLFSRYHQMQQEKEGTESQSQSQSQSQEGESTMRVVRMYENQRWSHLYRTWSRDHLLKLDPNPYTTTDWKLTSFNAPPQQGWEWTGDWQIEKNLAKYDDEGWEYSPSFNLARAVSFAVPIELFSNSSQLTSQVRRRCWQRPQRRNLTQIHHQLSRLTAVEINKNLCQTTCVAIEKIQSKPIKQQKQPQDDSSSVDEYVVVDQDCTCADCGVEIDGVGIRWEGRRCEFNGKWYCCLCHRQESVIIPAFVLAFADFTPRQVSHRAYDWLTMTVFENFFCTDHFEDECGRMHKRVVPIVRKMMELSQIREVLCLQMKALRLHVDFNFDEMRQLIYPREYLWEDSISFSMHDIKLIWYEIEGEGQGMGGQTLTSQLHAVHSAMMSHFDQCTLCASAFQSISAPRT